MIVTARKIIRVGSSNSICIPPHVLDHLGVSRGDILGWDISVENYAIINRLTIPPYLQRDETPPVDHGAT